MVYVFDAGHGLTTKGKRSPDHRFFEYWFNREIVRRVSKQLDELGIKYFYTYPLEEDYDLSLRTRAQNCNKIAKEFGVGNVLMISVHSNAAGMGDKWMNAKGFSVWTTKGQNNSDKYAQICWNEAKKVCDKYNRTIRKDTYSDGDEDYESNFTVIYNTICPSFLVELFFYDNQEECEWLLSEEGKQACTEILVNTIKRIEGLS